MDEFSTFWQHYPLKVAKVKAAKAYVKARTQASAEALLDGVERYRLSKPAWQEWAYPASWLNAGRWLDEDAPPRASGPAQFVSAGPSARDLELIAEYDARRILKGQS